MHCFNFNNWLSYNYSSRLCDEINFHKIILQDGVTKLIFIYVMYVNYLYTFYIFYCLKNFKTSWLVIAVAFKIRLLETKILPCIFLIKISTNPAIWYRLSLLNPKIIINCTNLECAILPHNIKWRSFTVCWIVQQQFL